jgi:hypothetical protein
VTLRVFLMPEGGISHYEMRGQTIEGAQTYFRAQGSRSDFPSDSAFVEMVAYLAAVVSVASSDLVNVYGVQGDITEAPGFTEGL